MTEQSSQFESLPLTEHDLGIQRRRGGGSTTSEVSTSASSPGIHWDPKMEIALFHAVMKNKPVGMHKHFRMLNIHRDFNANSPVKLTIPELWERLSQYFALDLLDDMEYEYEDEDNETNSLTEFSLPNEEYDHLIPDQRKPSMSSGSTPPPIQMRPGRRRDSSPTPSSTPSSVTTPETEEAATRKPKRPTRAPKKSELNEPPTPTRVAARRGRGRRPSDTSANAATTTGPTSGGVPKRGRGKKVGR
ncbi:10832_t:CDS:2 [Paraglomus occultum]|uniref:10832_t:CDS:1 n=1 Tax=Paraglomus occultum TaxID=144539 RepID=A0A9N9FI78_9GLOM|nr:10832_t:CDS:2 [Paraglomus occultum]